MSHKPETAFSREFLETFNKETPFFLFSKEKVLDKYKEFLTHFPHASVFYAMKANSEPEILETLRDAGSGFEVASKYELNILKKIGVDPEKIMYGSAVKPAEALKEFFEYGVRTFSFDSLQELDKIAITAPGSRVYCRAIVNDAGSVFQFSEKFGTSKENIVPFLLRARDLGLVPYGISFHVGSQASNEMAWAHALKGLEDVFGELEKVGITLEVINIGGGYPCNKYRSFENDFELEDIARDTLAQYKKLSHQPKIVLEPGRAIVADSGILVASVIAKIERKEHTWLFLDAGVYNALFETMAYQGSTDYKATSLRPSFDSGEMLFALAGPTGDSCDVISREVLLPRDIGVGDKIIFHNVGAYSTVCTSPFNGFPKPEVYFI